MADLRLNIPGTFENYVKARKPFLDEAFEKTLSGIMDGIAVRSGLSLVVAALQAGKKLRGCLACLVSDALGGEFEAAVPRAIAVELIQAATLIHDDFVDQDTTRRGRPAVWTLEGARRAVLIGDLVFASAIRMMSELSEDDGLAASSAIAEVSKGALHEPLNPVRFAEQIESHGVDGQFYEKIIRLKTGILFGAAARLGAIAAGANHVYGEDSFRYGLRLGEAYQIADDLEEVKHHITTGAVSPKEMVELAPGLLHFVPESRSCVIGFLRGDPAELSAGHTEIFRRAAHLMEAEIGLRSGSAVTQAERVFPENGFGILIREAPGAIIRMFNGSARTSLP